MQLFFTRRIYIYITLFYTAIEYIYIYCNNIDENMYRWACLSHGSSDYFNSLFFFIRLLFVPHGGIQHHTLVRLTEAIGWFPALISHPLSSPSLCIVRESRRRSINQPCQIFRPCARAWGFEGRKKSVPPVCDGGGVSISRTLRDEETLLFSVSASYRMRCRVRFRFNAYSESFNSKLKVDFRRNTRANESLKNSNIFVFTTRTCDANELTYNAQEIKRTSSFTPT